MVSLASLWLPILLSAVGVFIASSVIWMALPIHKKDYKKLGDKEAAVMAAVRSWGLGAGMYMFPFCDPKGPKDDPAMKKKIADGPWGTIMLMPRVWNMGRMMGLWVLNLLILTTFVAYIAGHGLAPGAAYLRVFQLVGATALLAYGGSSLTDSIWKGRPWSLLPGALFDAVVYALVTGAVFGALWPKV